MCYLKVNKFKVWKKYLYVLVAGIERIIAKIEIAVHVRKILQNKGVMFFRLASDGLPYSILC